MTVYLFFNTLLQAVAEGVETQSELPLVRECQCDEYQAHLLARPMPAAGFAAWLLDGNAQKNT